MLAETKKLLDGAKSDTAEPTRTGTSPVRNVQRDRLDVVDFPTPMIALHEFVSHVKRSVLKREPTKDSVAGYWQREEAIQYAESFGYLDSRIREEGMASLCIGYFDYKKSPDFTLPD